MQINIRCTLEERTRIMTGAVQAHERKHKHGEGAGWGYVPPFSFARWAIDSLTAAAAAAKPLPKATKKKATKKKATKKKATKKKATKKKATKKKARQ